ncbi:hypothetical protein [Niveispirillum irakense]|uniref:hypothetical protein n=1 Tax=Niveispirillum irakense TaxID=34011 RepID=UPI0012B63BD9|nr:hypothetical protein [Niveispirillum irakense]
MSNFYAGTVYRGEIVIDNRMGNVSIVLGRPTNEYQGSVVIEPLWGDNPTYTIPQNSGEASFGYTLEAGVLVDPNADRIQIPLTLSKPNNPSVAGMITIMTADGTVNPNTVIVQLTLGQQTTNQSISVSSWAPVEMNVDLDSVNLIFTDGGQISTANPTGAIFDAALEVAVKMAAG